MELLEGGRIRRPWASARDTNPAATVRANNTLTVSIVIESGLVITLQRSTSLFYTTFSSLSSKYPGYPPGVPVLDVVRRKECGSVSPRQIDNGGMVPRTLSWVRWGNFVSFFFFSFRRSFWNSKYSKITNNLSLGSIQTNSSFIIHFSVHYKYQYR